MTEAAIFNNLLKNEKRSEYNFDFPKQQSETVRIVARNLAEVIYESYKRKSCASTSKRHSVLKFINHISEVPEPHNYEDYMICALKQIDSTFKCIEEEDVENLKNKIAADLKVYNNNRFQRKIHEYSSRKSRKETERMRKLEKITERDQKKLNKKYCLEVRKRYLFEPNENLLNKLLVHNGNLESNSMVCDIGGVYGRENMVKLAYAMLNKEQNHILKKILLRISSFSTLNKAETNFIQYVWCHHYDTIKTHMTEYLNIFYFILEQILLKYATDILDLDNDEDICQYFDGLENDCNILKIKNICKIDTTCCLKLKNLLYELYCISYCNEVILKLNNIIL